MRVTSDKLYKTQAMVASKENRRNQGVKNTLLLQNN